MDIKIVFLLLSAVFSLPTLARDEPIKFEGVQDHCVPAGKVTFGANAYWSDCSVTKGRWFATLDFIDMYQAQYCLRKGDGECAQRAITVFGNRAYTPNAKVILQRIDPGNAEYDDPLVIQTKYGNILTLSAKLPDGGTSKTYYRWKAGRWLPLNSGDWLRDLSRRLPKGEKIVGDVSLDTESMSAQATVHDAGARETPDRTVEVKLGLANNSFSVQQVTAAHRKMD